MKTEKHILISFFANVILAAVELIGGLIVGSIAVVGDSLHSLGDSVTIGIAFFLEKQSHKKADKRHTFGYARYSMLGGLLTNMFLIVSAFTVIMHSIHGLFEPHEIQTGGMLVLALLGAFANLIAAIATRKGDSANEKAVSLHAVQDVLTHLALILGAVIMKQTGFMQIDSVLSILIAGFILCHAVHHLSESVGIFLDNVPAEIDPDLIEQEIMALDGVEDVHHLHIWSLDGDRNCATLHIKTKKNSDASCVKCQIRKIMAKDKIEHVTIENDSKDCTERNCKIKQDPAKKFA